MQINCGNSSPVSRNGPKSRYGLVSKRVANPSEFNHVTAFHWKTPLSTPPSLHCSCVYPEDPDPALRCILVKKNLSSILSFHLLKWTGTHSYLGTRGFCLYAAVWPPLYSLFWILHSKLPDSCIWIHRKKFINFGSMWFSASTHCTYLSKLRFCTSYIPPPPNN